MNVNVLNTNNNSIRQNNLPQKVVNSEATAQNNNKTLSKQEVSYFKGLFPKNAKQIDAYVGKGSILDITL